MKKKNDFFLKLKISTKLNAKITHQKEKTKRKI